MKFLPIESIIYKTRLNEEEVIKRLEEILEPEQILRLGIFSSDKTKPYEGHIRWREFSMRRIIDYRNSFIPRINGTVEKDDEGTIIKVKMRLHIFVILFLCIWCGAVGLVCIVIMKDMFDNSEFNSGELIPFGMLLFAYALTMGGFKFESNKTKKYLKTIFEADIVKE